MYISMLKDGFNMQCLASIIFLFFACISPIVTFGGLMGQKTDGHMVSNSWTKRQYINVYQWLLSLNYVAGRSDLVVSAYTTAVWEDPGSNLIADGLCLSRRPLWYAALGTGCALAAVPRSTQPCIPIGSLIEYQLRLVQVGNVTSAGWQVTLCDPIRHVSSGSVRPGCITPANCYATFTYLLYLKDTQALRIQGGAE